MTEIVALARGYLGTPYHHQGRKKGVGVDCVGLPVCLAWDIGLLPREWNVTGYGQSPDGYSLREHLNTHLVHIPRNALAPGDVVLVAYDALPHHVGVVGDYVHGGLSIIHASSVHKRVIETRLLFSDAMRFCGAYRFPEVSHG